MGSREDDAAENIGENWQKKLEFKGWEHLCGLKGQTLICLPTKTEKGQKKIYVLNEFQFERDRFSPSRLTWCGVKLFSFLARPPILLASSTLLNQLSLSHSCTWYGFNCDLLTLADYDISVNFGWQKLHHTMFDNLTTYVHSKFSFKISSGQENYDECLGWMC